MPHHIPGVWVRTWNWWLQNYPILKESFPNFCSYWSFLRLFVLHTANSYSRQLHWTNLHRMQRQTQMFGCYFVLIVLCVILPAVAWHQGFYSFGHSFPDTADNQCQFGKSVRILARVLWAKGGSWKGSREQGHRCFASPISRVYYFPL